MRPSALTIFAIAFTRFVFSQPVVTAVENNYSNIFADLPNYGIAQGSIFVIYGSGLASEASGLQNAPLKQSLNGVSVSVTVNGTAAQPWLYYVTDSQIAAILPSSTPAGTGTITVTSSGQTSAPAPIVVVTSAVGIATTNGSGLGSAAALDANSNLLTASNSANPGDTIVLWGSGLGAVTGDESVPRPQSLDQVPIEVEIGGKPASVTFHGRSQYPGLDQINVVVPDAAPGCFVSVVVRTGNIVSNSPTIPVAPNGRTCSDVPYGPMGTISKANVTGGAILLTRSTFFSAFGGNPLPTATEDGLAVFSQDGQMYIVGSPPGAPSAGSCVIQPFPWPTPPSIIQDPPPRGLDAGPAVTITDSNGRVVLPHRPAPWNNQAYSAQLATAGIAPFLADAGGLYAVANGGGGADVGPFLQQFNLPPLLVWTNLTTTAIDRSKGLTVTWSGGDPQGVVFIEGTSYVPDGSKGVEIWCEALGSDHQFTIPASTLLAAPPLGMSTTDGLSPFIDIRQETTFLFPAPGLDVATFSVQSGSTSSVPFQ